MYWIFFLSCDCWISFPENYGQDSLKFLEVTTEHLEHLKISVQARFNPGWISGSPFA